MMDSLAIIFGLTSAITFGSGDFAGGFATKKNNVFIVLVISQIAGLILLILLALIIGENILFDQMIFGSLSGIFGGLGLLAFYRGLAIGNMAVVAPITAVIAPLLPLIFNLFSNPSYTFFQILGFILALISIWMVSSTKSEGNVSFLDVKLAILAGLGFGLFLIFINLASTLSSYFFPLIFARIASITMVFIIILITKQPSEITPKSVLIISLAGIFDTLGNVFFVLSSIYGRLDIASILTSMGPVVTIILASTIIKEKITRMQLVGIFLALTSIILISYK
ncbi:MAG: EamA family transporter [Candidatus Thorarchaeota archaeon]